MFPVAAAIAVLCLNGIAYVAVGFAFYVTPETYVASLGFSCVRGPGLVELKTVYSGLMCSLGIFFLLGAMLERLRYAAALVMFLTYAGVVVVRGLEFSKGTDGNPVGNDFLWSLFYTEIVGAVLAAIVLFILRGPISSERKVVSASTV